MSLSFRQHKGGCAGVHAGIERRTPDTSSTIVQGVEPKDGAWSVQSRATPAQHARLVPRCCSDRPHLNLHTPVLFQLLLVFLELFEFLLQRWQLHELAVHDLDLVLQLLRNRRQLLA